MPARHKHLLDTNLRLCGAALLRGVNLIVSDRAGAKAGSSNLSCPMVNTILWAGGDIVIREERIKKTFWELALTNSPSRAERPLCDYLQNRLQGLGLTVWEDGAAAVVEGNSGNLHARAGDRVRRVLMAHMDTVQPTIGLRPQHGRHDYRAGGTILNDDKAGITAILEA